MRSRNVASVTQSANRRWSNEECQVLLNEGFSDRQVSTLLSIADFIRDRGEARLREDVSRLKPRFVDDAEFVASVMINPDLLRYSSQIARTYSKLAEELGEDGQLWLDRRYAKLLTEDYDLVCGRISYIRNSHEGLYCRDCRAYKIGGELVEGTVCPVHGSRVEVRTLRLEHLTMTDEEWARCFGALRKEVRHLRKAI